MPASSAGVSGLCGAPDFDQDLSGGGAAGEGFVGLREAGEVEAGAEDGADPPGLPEVEEGFGGAAQLAGLCWEAGTG